MTMALPAAFLSEDQFSCSICLEVFENPVSTPCGHSFCQSCISYYWDTQGGAKVVQCPLCKESFRKRPELHVNLTLKEITEQFKRMAIAGVRTDGSGGAAPPMPPPTRPGEMGSVFAEMMARFQQPQTPGSPQATLSHPNDRHLQRPSQAFKAQNCEPLHPPPPYSPRRRAQSGPGETSPNLPPCPIHMKGLELFCRTDNTCVCSVCVETAAHQGHNIIPAKREWLIKKSQLGIEDMKLKDLICARERKVEEIQSSLQQMQVAAKRDTEQVVYAFSKLISATESCQAEVLQVIERTCWAAERRAQSMLRELEEEIAELQKKSTALKQLAVSEDYILFLKQHYCYSLNSGLSQSSPAITEPLQSMNMENLVKNLQYQDLFKLTFFGFHKCGFALLTSVKAYPALSTPPQTKDWSDVSLSSELTSGVILGTVNQIHERFKEELRTLPDVCQQSILDQSVPRLSPKVRRVQEYAEDITLDPHTAHPRLVISVDGKQVHCGDRQQLVPDNPERFDRVVCVLARQGFSSGRHYWEVEVGAKTDWDLGVASWSVNRKGKITVSPAHGYWFLSLRDRSDYTFRTEPLTKLTVSPRPSRIGIFLDYDKGLVSFYNLEAKVLIYTFTDSFLGPVHPFFSPCTNKSGKNEAPLIICPVTMSE